MKKSVLPSNVFVLITTAEELRTQDQEPSFLTKDYDLPSMISCFQRKLSKKITLDVLEASFRNPTEAIPNDIEKIKAILVTGEDFTEKINRLISLYEKVHSYSKDFLIITLAKLLFTKESWFRENEGEASRLFQTKQFDGTFFDQRRNSFCLHDDE